MPLPDHSAWDVTEHEYEALTTASLPKERALKARCDRRIAMYESSAERMQADPQSPDHQLAALAEEHQRRVGKWAARSQVSRPGCTHLVFTAILVAAASPALLASIVGARPRESFIVLMICAILGAPLLFVLFRRIGWVRFDSSAVRDLRSATCTANRTCGDCGYDLTGAPPGLPADQMNGVNVGPRRCPECGAPWPLVPPA